MKKIASIVLMCGVVLLSEAQINTPLPTDTLARDLSDLEKKLSEENATEEADTTNYGARKQTNFNALIYSLDKRHRYAGDRWQTGNFGKHTFLDFGAGAVFYQHNNHYQLTPQVGIRLRLGKELSPMSSFRIGIGGELGYITHQENVNWTIRAEADYLFNFSNYLLGYRPDRPMSVLGVMGLGVQHAHLTKYDRSDIAKYMKEKALSVNVRAGMQFRFFAGDHAALAIEPYVMAGTEGMDLDIRKKFNHFSFGYGVNLSYIWYFYNNLSSEKDAGTFYRRFANGERLFLEDPVRRRWRKPWFFDYSIGAVFYQRTPLSLGKTMGYSISAGLGQWLSSAIGVRGGVSITNAAWTERQPTTSLLGKSGVYVDALLNPFGFSRHYDWDAPVGMNLFTGYEMGKMQMVHADVSDKTSGNYAGYRLGAQFWARLSDDLRLTFEPSYMIMQHFDRPNDRIRFDQMDAKLGLTVLFRGLQHRLSDSEQGIAMLPERGFYVGGGLGWNTTVNKWRYTDKNRGGLLNVNGFAGYNFNMYHGAKLMVDYVSNPIWNQNSVGDFTKQTYKNTFISADYQLNVLNAMVGYQPERRWSVGLYAGPSLVLSDVGRKVDLGANIGGMISYRVLPYLSLFYSHTVYWMPASHYDSPQIYTTPGAIANVLTLGAQYHLNGFFKTIRNLPWRNATNNGRHRFFLDYGYGYGVYPMLPNKASESWGSTMQLSLGWWGNAFLGARFGLNMSKGNLFTTQNTDKTETATLYHSFGMATLAADLLFNPLGLSKNYNWQSLVGGHLIAGYQAGLLVLNDQERTIKGSDVTVGGLRLGAQLWVRLSRELKLNIEPMYSMLTTGKNFYFDATTAALYRTPTSGATPLKLGNSFAVKMGVSVLLNRFSRYEDADLKAYAEKNPQRIFIGLGAGWNILLSKHRYKDNGLKLNLTAFGGYKLNETSSIRLGLEYIIDDIRFGMTYAGSTSLIGEKQKIAFLALNYQVDILSFFRGYNPQRVWNMNLYAGPAIGLQTNNERNKDGAVNMGMVIDYRLTSRLSAFYHHNIYLLGFLGQPELLPGTNLFGRVTALNAINFGLQYHF